MAYTGLELAAYFIIYSFLGWMVEVGVVAVKDRRFRNRGFINLPFCFMYGVMMTILIVSWPNLSNQGAFKFIFAFIVFVVVQSIAEFFTRRICKRMMLKFEDITPYNGQWANFAVATLFAAGLWLTAEVLHPFIFMFVALLPEVVLEVICKIAGLIFVLDSLVTIRAAASRRTGDRAPAYQEMRKDSSARLNERIYHSIWNRLEKAYPNMQEDEELEKEYVFAKGICLDKIIWVFLISAFLGDLIEMVYCRMAGGEWMSRSSVLYGPFSIVWGIGAVLLTLVLSRFADKEDRYIFLIGALIGGVYEYVCSLFTEIFLGTVFWDYSWMPFNIGGRTNLLYMVFWGVLSVAWIKVCYPKISGGIEKLPALQGKIITWILIVFMVCNALISAMAMVRYTQRQEGIAADNVIEAFIDANYEDSLIEKVWPNMVITD
uniref:putative ABC transporter permease n=1 Tax=Agathobacter sp. TaxID=2021311 RepID=UPI004056EFD6